MLSDRLGRHLVLTWVMLIGFICFAAAALSKDSPVILFISFFIAGMAVGSTFSLGISFMADLLPKNLLPAGNIMCGIFYSIACMIGPFFSGLLIQYVKGPSFFYLLSLMLIIIFFALLSARGKQNVSTVHH
jgi:MFS family permease